MMSQIFVAQYRRRADARSTLDAVVGLLGERVGRHAGFVVLPENAFAAPDAGPLPPALRDEALTRLAELARRRGAYVLTGSWAQESASGAGLDQVAHLLDPAGEVRAVVRRSVDDRSTTATGDDFPVVDTEHGRVGVLLGPDFWLVEPPRIQCLAGAELLLVAGSTSGVTTDSQHAAVWGIATLNTVGVALAAGLDAPSAGGSGIAVPDGFLAWAGTRESVPGAAWDPDHIRHLRQPDLRFQETLWFGLWARRPELYGSLTGGQRPTGATTGTGG
ncbi:carbon-nitrogen hydrolase family protein [Streptomyces cyaneofuscatus]|uniref:carbon-nitrogen hydrolase family protein n=2 Tax=Streptomyces cyaneofuscatus TaxID=66883 RepID=UPI0036DB009F